jgi:hypothetical protein
VVFFSPDRSDILCLSSLDKQRRVPIIIGKLEIAPDKNRKTLNSIAYFCTEFIMLKLEVGFFTTLSEK